MIGNSMKEEKRMCVCIYIYTDVHVCMYDWVTMLYSREWRNTVNQLQF